MLVETVPETREPETEGPAAGEGETPEPGWETGEGEAQEPETETGEDGEPEAGKPEKETGEALAGSEAEPEQAEGPETDQEDPWPLKLVFASDLHLLADSLHDGGEAYREKLAADDGKVTPYSSQILKALLQEAADLDADAVILHGDLTYNGDWESHLALAEMLREARERLGLRILILPGNHDINNPDAAWFYGAETGAARPVTPEEFEEIYREFGYEEAASRDETSLSYMWKLNEAASLMLLDTNIYEPVNRVNGEIEPETYEWMIRQLDLAEEQGVQVLPAGHHNLLQESRLYTWDCVIESRQSAIWLFGEHQLPLYISGHLHASRTRRNKTAPGMPDDAYGIWEAVTGSVSMAPCTYLLLTWEEDGTMDLSFRETDVAAWAARNGETDPNLLDFRNFSVNWYYEVIQNQVLKKTRAMVPEEYAEEMARTYADVLYHYCAGSPLPPSEVRQSEGYRLWQRFAPEERWTSYLDQILKDYSY